MAKEKKCKCPDCGVEMVIKADAEVGDILECAKCGTEVEILSLSPLKCEELIEEK